MPFEHGCNFEYRNQDITLKKGSLSIHGAVGHVADFESAIRRLVSSSPSAEYLESGFPLFHQFHAGMLPQLKPWPLSSLSLPPEFMDEGRYGLGLKFSS